MSRIFISYRREDSQAWAVNLGDELSNTFGRSNIFLDHDSIHAGDWNQQISIAMQECKVFIVVIGINWLQLIESRKKTHQEEEQDVHKMEILKAINSSTILVIPVLVDDARMPTYEQLPHDLKKLHSKNARTYGKSRTQRDADLLTIVNDIKRAGLQTIHPLGSGLKPSIKIIIKCGIISYTITWIMSVCIEMFTPQPLSRQEDAILFFTILISALGITRIWSHRRK